MPPRQAQFSTGNSCTKVLSEQRAALHPLLHVLSVEQSPTWSIWTCTSLLRSPDVQTEGLWSPLNGQVRLGHWSPLRTQHCDHVLLYLRCPWLNSPRRLLVLLFTFYSCSLWCLPIHNSSTLFYSCLTQQRIFYPVYQILSSYSAFTLYKLPSNHFSFPPPPSASASASFFFFLFFSVDFPSGTPHNRWCRDPEVV